MKKNLPLKVAVTVAYFAMIGVNYLANALPIGGITTGEASDSYANLFTPTGLTFSIWGLIYLLLLGTCLYQFNLWDKSNKKREETFQKVGRLFFMSSLANIAWVFAWHYGVIWLSVLIMIALLVLLIKIADIVNNEKYSLQERLFIRLPFSVYFGWITVASIANITVLLVSLGWDGFGISESIWTIIVLYVGAAIGITRMMKDKNIAYGLVLIWAYAGILIKHSSEAGFNGEYQNIITTILICIGLYLASIGTLIYKNDALKKT